MARPENPRTTAFGQHLAKIRHEAGLSVTALAGLASVSPSSVTAVATGKRGLTGPMARKLAGPLGIMPNELLVSASLTPEFPWERALSGGRRRSELMVTDDEERELAEFLSLMRVRGWLERVRP